MYSRAYMKTSSSGYMKTKSNIHCKILVYLQKIDDNMSDALAIEALSTSN